MKPVPNAERLSYASGLHFGLWLGAGLVIAAELAGYFASFFLP